MHDQPLVVWARARRMLDAYLRPAVHGPAIPLEVAALHVHGEPIDVAEARRRTFTPFAIGDAWGAAWDTTWFRMRGTVPAEWAGEEVVARVGLGYAGQTGFGAEALLWDGDAPVQGITPNHDEVCVARPARGGEAVDLLVEAAANPHVDAQQAVYPPLLPDPGGAPLFHLQRAEICVVHRDLDQFCRDLSLVLDLSTKLGDEGARAGRLLAALRSACMLVDPESPSTSLPAAHAPLRDALAATGASRRHRVVAEGHAHIDTAWLWPLRETKRKCARSFSTVLSLMDDHPAFRFACSQMQHYAWMRDHYPTLFARIRDRVAAGQWEPVGGMWVETDCNIASAESLVRQVVHGKLFLIEELGYEPRVGWLPDTFGFPATLPQILRESGMPHFLTQKLWWNQVDAFPHSTFWWEGLDGSRVLTHFPPAATYNGDASPGELLRTESNFHDHSAASSSMYLYGHGDGGGGPTRGMLEQLDRMADVDGLPRVEHGTAHEFFARTEAEDGDALPTWRGELYLERHRGVFTTQGAVKRGNREAERLLRQAETWSCLHPDGLAAYPAADLDAAWKLTLLHQFHDILPGSSIEWVYQDAARDHQRVHDLATRAIDTATQAIVTRVDSEGMLQPVVIFNASSFDRSEVVDVGGRPMLVEAPACGYAVLDTAQQPAANDPVITGNNSMENALLRVRWDGDGLLTSVYDKQAGREVLAAGERGNVLQLFRDHPSDYDAWEIDADDLHHPQALTSCESIEMIEATPLRAAVRTVRRTAASTVTQTMVLRSGSRRVEFHTTVDWQETHRLLKVAFPVAVRAARAAFDVGFGHVERPTHENTSWDAAQFEVPAHRFADLSEHGYGVALLNDCKHGYDVRGSTLRLTLLRAPTMPAPRADRGVHQLTYALFPHPGDLVSGGVVEEAEALDLPLRCVATAPHRGDLPRRANAVSVDGPGVAVTAVKKSERGEALVVRICEVAGGRRTVRVNPGITAVAAARCDLLERPREPLALRDGAVQLELGPFQLATLRFELR
jgi:alpha-mannosidase